MYKYIFLKIVEEEVIHFKWIPLFFRAAYVEFSFTSNWTYSNDMLCKNEYFGLNEETYYSLFLYIQIWREVAYLFLVVYLFVVE